jgi:hypothetical protein
LRRWRGGILIGLTRLSLVCLFLFWGRLSPAIAQDSWAKLIPANMTVLSGSPRLMGIDSGHADLTLETGGRDQCRIKLPDGREIRVKENSRLIFSGNDQVRVERGLAGFRLNPGAPVLRIKIFPAEFLMAEGIAVCKAYSGFFRLAALKGRLSLLGVPETTRGIIAPAEIAGAVQEISQTYPPLDDLYFAWYWDAGPSAQ